jgi:hypothetical protein
VSKHQFQTRQFTSSTLAEATKVRDQVNALRYDEAHLRLLATYHAYKTCPGTQVSAKQADLLKQASSMAPTTFAQAWQETMQADAMRSKLLEAYKKACTNFQAFFPKVEISQVTQQVDAYLAKTNKAAS